MKKRKPTLKDLVKPIDPNNPFNQPRPAVPEPAPLALAENNERAAEIVRAINSHEALYSALKNLVAGLDKQFPDSIREPLRSLVVRADQALAQAEGK